MYVVRKLFKNAFELTYCLPKDDATFRVRGTPPLDLLGGFLVTHMASAATIASN